MGITVSNPRPPGVTSIGVTTPGGASPSFAVTTAVALSVDLGGGENILTLTGSSITSLETTNGGAQTFNLDSCTALATVTLSTLVGCIDLDLNGWSASVAEVDATLQQASSQMPTGTIDVSTTAGTSQPSAVPDVTVTGTLLLSGGACDVAGTYAFDATGTTNGAPRWKKSAAFGVGVDGYIAWDGASDWYLSDSPGAVGASGYWSVAGDGTGWAGEYAPDGVTATGTATVAGGTGATTKGMYYVAIINGATGTPTYDT